MSRILCQTIVKLHRRKPWVFDKANFPSTPEEENKSFLALKAAEKNEAHDALRPCSSSR